MGRAMFLKLAMAALINRRSRLAVVLTSVVIGAAVVSGLVSLYENLGEQVGRELRGYGANFAALPAGRGGEIDVRLTDEAARAFGERLVGYSPFIYARVAVGGTRAVLVGQRPAEFKKISPYVSVTPKTASWSKGVLVGRQLAERLGSRVGDKIRMTVGRTAVERRVLGVVESGGAEENQIFIDLRAAQRLVGKQGRASLAYFSVVNEDGAVGRQVEAVGSRLGLKLEPIGKISVNESKILDRLKNFIFLVSAIILATCLLSVSTTMMATVMERRREVGLKKALGAENGAIFAEFAAEGVLIGAVGGLIGWSVGHLFAVWLAERVFSAAISLSWQAAAISLAVSMTTAVVAMAVPARAAVLVQPALVLKGE